MKALITGASSGFGRDMAYVFSQMGYDIIAVARRKERLEALKKELKTNVEIIVADVSDPQQCYEIAARAKEVDVLINNAGFGVFGEFCLGNLDDELKMLDTNVRAVHILTKLFVQEFKKRNSGYILNVASLAAFFPGPLFGAYYATKSYVLRLSQAIGEELRREKSNVKISVLCPGPVKTEFGKVAKVGFGSSGKKAITSEYVAKYAIEQLFKEKEIIIPGTMMKVSAFLRHILPEKALAKIVYLIQSKKCVLK